MGGTAFGTPSKRLDKREYECMAPWACQVVGSLGFRCAVIPSHRNKETFGDIDIIAEDNGEDLNAGVIAAALGAEKFRRNGDCLSLLTDGVQVDIIFARRGMLDTALGYFSWPDLGNFVGRMARAGGFRYGHLGLFRRVNREGGRGAAHIPLSTDTGSILEFFGLDRVRWSMGFDSLEEIYGFLADSQFFSIEIFSPERIGHADRVRNKKRPVYRGILDWARGKNVPNFDFCGSSPEWWDRRATDHFGDRWIRDREARRTEDLMEMELARKFNGERVRDLTGLNGRALGEFMRAFRGSVAGGVKGWVMATGQDDIDREILSFFKSLDAGGTGLAGRGGG